MAHPDYRMASLPQFVGKEIGVSCWLTVDQRRIDEFADCTGDRQWIHVDVERARKESPFGGTIAHGYLTLSLAAFLAMDAGVIPADCVTALNYGLDKVRMLTPVKAGSRVRNVVVLMGVESKGAEHVLIRMLNTIEIEGETKPALIAESLALLMKGRAAA